MRVRDGFCGELSGFRVVGWRLKAIGRFETEAPSANKNSFESTFGIEDLECYHIDVKL